MKLTESMKSDLKQVQVVHWIHEIVYPNGRALMQIYRVVPQM